MGLHRWLSDRTRSTPTHGCQPMRALIRRSLRVLPTSTTREEIRVVHASHSQAGLLADRWPIARPTVTGSTAIGDMQRTGLPDRVHCGDRSQQGAVELIRTPVGRLGVSPSGPIDRGSRTLERPSPEFTREGQRYRSLFLQIVASVKQCAFSPADRLDLRGRDLTNCRIDPIVVTNGSPGVT